MKQPRDPIEMTEVEPGIWMTRSQAKAHRIVRESLANSDFTGSKWRLEEAIGRLPFSLRVCIFLLYIAAVIVIFIKLETFAKWLVYS